MAGFKTHITTSTILGVGYGAGGYFLLSQHTGTETPITTCVLATGLCSISGMLPDLDSDTGIPLRETIAFTAAVVPMLLVHRLAHLGLTHEMMVLAGVLTYLAIRFGLFEILKRYTVHRGMFHSLPAALIAAELAYLLCSSDVMGLRLYKSGAVLVGYLSHLCLDEIYSFEWNRGRWRIKSSFGTAMKLWGSNWFANLSTYVKLGVLAFIALQDPIWMDKFESQIEQGKQLPKIAVEKIDEIWR